MRVVYKIIGFLSPDPHIDSVISPIDLPQMSLTSVSGPLPFLQVNSN